MSNQQRIGHENAITQLTEQRNALRTRVAELESKVNGRARTTEAPTVKSDWVTCGDGPGDCFEINFLPGDACPKQIRIWARPQDFGDRAEVQVEIVPQGQQDSSGARPCDGQPGGQSGPPGVER
jgi:hypothetical protein